MINEHDELMKIALSDPEIKKAYEKLEDEFQMLDEMLKARNKAGKTQADIAHEMETSISIIGWLENSGGKKKHSPSIATLRRYAKAVGCKLQIKLIPIK